MNASSLEGQGTKHKTEAIKVNIVGLGTEGEC